MSPSFVAEQTSGTAKGWLSNRVGTVCSTDLEHQRRRQAARPEHAEFDATRVVERLVRQFLDIQHQAVDGAGRGGHFHERRSIAFPPARSSTPETPASPAEVSLVLKAGAPAAIERLILIYRSPFCCGNNSGWRTSAAPVSRS
jgi:hypothetical protein